MHTHASLGGARLHEDQRRRLVVLGSRGSQRGAASAVSEVDVSARLQQHPQRLCMAFLSGLT